MKITPIMLGALPGAALASAGGYQSISSMINSRKFTTEDLVNARQTAKKYAPDAYVATSKADVLKLNIPKEHKDLINKNFSQAFDGRNAALINSNDKSIILSPKMVNKSMLGHEIGHHLSGKPSFIDTIIKSRDEQKAWDASPIKVDAKTRDTMLGTYRGNEKIMSGLLTATVGGILADILAKRLRK